MLNQSLSRSLSRRVLVFNLISVVSLLGIGVLGVIANLQQVTIQFSTTIVDATSQLDYFLVETRNTLVAGRDIYAADLDTSATLRAMQTRNRNLSQITFFDLEGEILDTRSQPGHPPLAADEVIAAWLAEPPPFGEVRIYPKVVFDGENPLLIVGVTAIDEIGLPVGIIVAWVDLTQLWESVLEIEVGQEGYAYLTDAEGHILAYRNRRYLGEASYLSDPLANAHPPSPATLQIHRGFDNLLVVSSARPLAEVSWWAVIEQPLLQALQPTYIPGLGLLFIVAGILLAVVNFIRFTRERITIPLVALTEAVAEREKRGHLGRVDINSSDELGRLAQTYNAMATELETLISSLEQRVQDRTRDLQLAATVSRQITTILDLNTLLPLVVENTRKSFEFYYVGIYLYEGASETLRQVAGGSGNKAVTFEVLPLTGKGLVPKAARLRQRVVADDVSLDGDHIPHSALPMTRSEAVLPMLIGENLVGLLDLQSEQIARFSSTDIQVLSTLAEQIGIALQNAQLYGNQLLVSEELRRLANMKSQFLASMSHELRTPLNAVLNFARLLEMGIYGEISPEQAEPLENIIISGQHLLELINDVLDITKIEAGMMQLFIEDDVNIQKEAQAVAMTAQALLEGKTVRFELEFSPEIPLMVGDRRRIRQILLNLVSNACKFTEEGSVSLKIQHQADSLLCIVSDTGIGIAPEDLELIFEPFRQTPEGIKQFTGTGLGLPIARTLAEAHGGKLWVESVLGEGSTFFVQLPFKGKEQESEYEL